MDGSKVHGGEGGAVSWPLRFAVSVGPICGRFHVGWQRSGRPVVQPTWRVVTDDSGAAHAVAGAYGGESVSAGPSSSGFEVLTRSDAVMVAVPGRKAVLPGMVLGGRGQIIHACEGVTASDPSCDVCASTGEGRRGAAWTGRGARAGARLRFGLVELPDLGLFEIASSSWDFAESLIGLGAVFDDAQGEVRGVLRLETVGFTTLSGIAVSYRKPVLDWGAGVSIGCDELGLAA